MNQSSIINIVDACNKININAFFVYWAISASPLFKKQWEHKIGAHFPLVSLCIILTHFSVCDQPSLPLCRRQAWNLSVPLKAYVSPLRRGGLASRLLEPRGKEQREERRGEDGRAVERRGKECVVFWAASQQPDSDRSASRLVPSVQWSRARRDCAVIGPALSIRKTGPERRGVAEYRSPVAVWIFVFYLKPSSFSLKKSNYTQTKSSYIKNPQIKSLKWGLIMRRWINISLCFFLRLIYSLI